LGVIVEPAPSAVAGSPGTYEWVGIWNRHFKVDPVKEVVGLFLAKFDSPDEEHADDLANAYWSLVCAAVVD
jgi:hypothetical protein